MLLSGVFERFPRLKFVMTENAAGTLPGVVAQMDTMIAQVQKGSIGELKYGDDAKLPKLASEYFAQNCYIGASFPGPTDCEVRHMLPEDRFMWGNDYPHDEGSGPFSRESLRMALSSVGEEEMRRILAENPAKLYDFDLDKLDELAAQYGPTVAELAEPLTELPENPNSALIKSASQMGLAA